MAVQYQEIGPNRVLAVLEAVGDVTSFIGVSLGKNAPASNGFTKGSYERRLDEVVRMTIRPVTIGSLIDIDPVPGLQVSGAYAEAAGIDVSSTFGRNQRLLLPTTGTIEASFEIIHKRRADMTAEEAVASQYYPEALFSGEDGITDETDGPGSAGFYAVRMTGLTAGIYAAELLVDDTRLNHSNPKGAAMSILYSLSEGSASNRPVHREIAVGDAAEDATGWMQLGKDRPLIEVRACSIDGTRDETLVGGQVRKNVAKYVKDQDDLVYTSVIVVEVRQSHEDSDQAGTVREISGEAFIQNMNASEVGDFVRLRIKSHTAGETIFMSVSKRGEQD